MVVIGSAVVASLLPVPDIYSKEEKTKYYHEVKQNKKRKEQKKINKIK